MKKNLIAVAVAGALVAPLTAQAIEMSADARVRYYSNDITEVGGATAETTGAKTDSRVGIDIKAAAGSAKAVARLEINNSTHGGAAETIDVERAYVNANIAGISVTGGKTVTDWGHKLYLWDRQGDRVIISKSMGDMVGGLAFTKITEAGLDASQDDDQDKSGTHLFFKMKGPVSGGIRYDMIKDETAGGGNSTDVNTADLYVTAGVGGGWAVAAEVTSVGGDGTGMGMLIAGLGKVGPADLMVGYVSAADGFTTDDDLLNFLAGGGTNPGSFLGGLPSAADGDSTGAVFVDAGFGITDNTSMKVAAASVTMSFDSGADDLSETVVSLMAKHNVGDNASLNAWVGSWTGDVIEAMQYGASIEASF